MNKPHVHKEIIIAWANGAKLQYKNRLNWIDTDEPSFDEDREYRIKPEREWPVTSFTDDEFFLIHKNLEPSTALHIFREIANAAIKQYIIDTENI